MMKNGHLIMKNNEKMMRKSTSPGCNSVAGRPLGVPYAAPIGAFFYELRVTRSNVVNLSLSRRNAASVGDVLSRRPATR